MAQSIRKTEVALSQLPTYTAGPLSVGTAKPLVEADPSGWTCPIERRNLISRQALLHRIMTEYDEMRGLRLTTAQAQRLFGSREDICLRVFNALVEAAILQIVRQCMDHGVRRVWFHRSFGNGSVSEAAVRECDAHGIDCIVGGCPLMFCDPVDFWHKCMKWWLQRQSLVPR